MYENIVFSGGGLRLFSYIGVLRALEEFNLLKNIKNFAGASGGAVVAAMIAMGYEHDELYDFIRNFDYTHLKDIQIFGINENFGLETGLKIDRFLQQMILKKMGKRELTFLEHYEATGNTLTVNATHLNNNKTVYFNHMNSPDMPIHVALRMTISLPAIISAVKWNGSVYVDGGLLENFPIKVFKPEKTLGITLTKSALITDNIDDLLQFLYGVWSCVYRTVNKLDDQLLKDYDIIQIATPKYSAFQFNLKRSDRKKLYKFGYKTAAHFFRSKGCKSNVQSPTNGLVQQLLEASSNHETTCESQSVSVTEIIKDT